MEKGVEGLNLVAFHTLRQRNDRAGKLLAKLVEGSPSTQVRNALGANRSIPFLSNRCSAVMDSEAKATPVSLDPSLRAALDKEARDLGVSRSRYIVALITAARATFQDRPEELRPHLPPGYGPRRWRRVPIETP
jgi:hypothetical protein